jgi:hypothetical protein
MKKFLLLLILLVPSVLYSDTNILGRLPGANFNTTADQAITVQCGSRWYPTAFRVTNASGSFTLSVGGFYTGASKTGTILVAAAQVYTALTGATKVLNTTLTAAATADTIGAQTIFFALTTAQGSAATADIYIIGDCLP